MANIATFTRLGKPAEFNTTFVQNFVKKYDKGSRHVKLTTFKPEHPLFNNGIGGFSFNL